MIKWLWVILLRISIKRCGALDCYGMNTMHKNTESVMLTEEQPEAAAPDPERGREGPPGGCLARDRTAPGIHVFQGNQMH